MVVSCEFDDFCKTYLCEKACQDPKAKWCDCFEPSSETYGVLHYCRFVSIRESECKNVAAQLASHQKEEKDA